MTEGNRFERVQRQVFERLIRELDPRLHYHNIGHTRNDVMPAVRRLAEAEGVGESDLDVLMTAALLHDMGFLERYEGNEEVAARMAGEMLPEFGYTSAQIECISGIIMATQVPQAPQTALQTIMCDADLDSLGREDFFSRSMDLRQEQCDFVEYISLRDWLEFELTFLEGHQYFLDTTKSLRDEGKARNIEELKKLFARVAQA
ncbi:MAG: phosphohydrolase [Kiritimatiellia bacterium]|jgi:predicted metal-dependent HD superfamily phosphohydrolase|nr:phosphohydrolase [Kiritimatiellia bacterium]MDP6848035.1 phosphohydrolase [Kiritimatiellia bacterium]